MAESARYVVTQPFTISYEKNGKQSIDVSPGDVIDFDGVNFSIGDVSGASSSLRVVVREGEWLRIEDGSTPLDLNAKPTVSPTRTYNATGGQQVEMSDPAADRNLYQGRHQGGSQSEKSLGDTVREYEEGTEKAGTTLVTDDMSDIHREVKVTTMDVREVAKVTDKGKNAAQSSSGVVSLRQSAPEGKRKVVQGVSMAKQTAPDKSPQGYKHIKVDSVAAGVVVGKVTDRSAATMNKKATEGEKRPTVTHQTVVKTTSRPASTRGDIGSSTQAAVVKQMDVAPEVTVVSTVREEFEVVSKDGIKSTMTVRPSDEISVGEVTSTSAEGGVELSGGDDLDVSDILQNS
jgi:hypothetical protein